MLAPTLALLPQARVTVAPETNSCSYQSNLQLICDDLADTFYLFLVKKKGKK